MALHSKWKFKGEISLLRGKVIRAIAVRDITERRRMEEARRKSQEEAVRAQKLLIALSQAAQAV